MLRNHNSELLDALVEADEAGSWQMVRSRFESLSLQSNEPEKLLASIQEELRHGHLPAGRVPYVHVNGFVKFVIAELPMTHARLTLHYWTGRIDDKVIEESRPHNHRFCFSSLLLLGKQGINEYDVKTCDSNATSIECEYRPHFGGRFAWIHRRRLVHLDTRRRVSRHPMVGIYHTDERTVHTTETTGRKPCATLVMRGPRVRNSANVYYQRITHKGPLAVQIGSRVGLSDMSSHIGTILKTI